MILSQRTALLTEINKQNQRKWYKQIPKPKIKLLGFNKKTKSVVRKYFVFLVNFVTDLLRDENNNNIDT